jgi:enoyl-CoA hydratase
VRHARLIGASRALDLILTGRPVGAEEALAMGLVNRIAPKGQARQAAETLAQDLARFPQECLRADRFSVYAQWDLPLETALVREFEQGVKVLQADGQAGAEQYFSAKRDHF